MTTPTREQALKWASEANLLRQDDDGGWSTGLPGSDFPNRLERLAALAYAAGAAAWKDAIWDARVDAGLDGFGDDADPKPVLKEAIDWRIQIALDPAVSSEAQALIDRGAAAEREACAKLCEEAKGPIYQWTDYRKFFAAVVRARGKE